MPSGYNQDQYLCYLAIGFLGGSPVPKGYWERYWVRETGKRRNGAWHEVTRREYAAAEGSPFGEPQSLSFSEDGPNGGVEGICLPLWVEEATYGAYPEIFEVAKRQGLVAA